MSNNNQSNNIEVTIRVRPLNEREVVDGSI